MELDLIIPSSVVAQSQREQHERVLPQSLEPPCTENSYTLLEIQMSFVKINAATRRFRT